MGGVNEKCHEYINGGVDETDPKWLFRTTSQAEMFADLFIKGILKPEMKCVDYACGTGALSNIFNDRIQKSGIKGCSILKYEKYTNFSENPEFLRDKEMKDKSFDVVTSSSVFEHLAGREQVNKVLRLLKDDGTFCVQTLICEDVPKDPEWFYLRPVHCTIWTNRSMDYFFWQYGFIGCAYNLKAQMWLMFRSAEVFERAKSIYLSSREVWTFSPHFIDYYKNLPYR